MRDLIWQEPRTITLDVPPVQTARIRYVNIQNMVEYQGSPALERFPRFSLASRVFNHVGHTTHHTCARGEIPKKLQTLFILVSSIKVVRFRTGYFFHIWASLLSRHTSPLLSSTSTMANSSVQIFNALMHPVIPCPLRQSPVIMPLRGHRRQCAQGTHEARSIICATSRFTVCMIQFVCPPKISIFLSDPRIRASMR